MPVDPLFRMTIQDVFFIRGRGTVVTGQVESGTLTVGDEICIRRQDSITKRISVKGIEAFRKLMNQAQAGENIGVLLSDVNKADVQKGDVLTGSDSEFTWKP